MSAEGTGGGLRSSALTPLLDTLFLLLFTLLATSRSATLVEDALREEVAVELPAVEDGEGAPGAEDPAAVWTLAVDREGAVGVVTGRAPGAHPVPVPGPGALARVLAEGRPRRVEIRADAAAAHGVVLDVLQAVRTAGVADVRFIAVEGRGEGRRFGQGEAR